MHFRRTTNYLYGEDFVKCLVLQWNLFHFKNWQTVNTIFEMHEQGVK